MASGAPSAEPELQIEVAGDVRVVVPADIRRMTPFILLEQEDWFEGEIGFVRRLLEPGEAAIDVGANYGLYTLAMARAVGPSGRVLAVEPASRTFGWLCRSLERNGFRQAQPIRVALSDRIGEAKLAVYDNSELNHLGPAVEAAAAMAWAETVPLSTLDALAGALGGLEAAFLKLDAEGEEERIIRGGDGFLRRQSPLVMLEIKHRQNPEAGPVAALARLGYAPYRLVPGLGLLAPFDPCGPLDRFDLNLFCCKPDRAAMLSGRSLLVEAGGAAALTVAGEPGDPFRAALADVVAAAEPGRPAAERLLRLRRARRGLIMATLTAPNVCRLASLARVAGDLGEHDLAVAALTRLRTLLDGPAEPLAEPLLPPEPFFDTVPPGEDLWGWLRLAAAEAWIRLSAFSSYFVVEQHRKVLEEIAASPLCSPEMLRRRHMLCWSTVGITAPPPPARLTRPAPGHRNDGLWQAWAEGRLPLPVPG